MASQSTKQWQLPTEWQWSVWERDKLPSGQLAHWRRVIQHSKELCYRTSLALERMQPRLEFGVWEPGTSPAE